MWGTGVVEEVLTCHFFCRAATGGEENGGKEGEGVSRAKKPRARKGEGGGEGEGGKRTVVLRRMRSGVPYVAA